MTSSPPPSDEPDAVDTLMDVSRLMTAVVARTLATVHEAVSVPQLRVLVMLHSDGPKKLGSIAEGLGVNPSNATRTADRLVEGGLARRRTDPEDRRVVVVTLTAKGRRLVDSLLDSRRRMFEELVAPMAPDEREVLARGLAAFLTAIEEADGDGDDEGRAAILHWIR